jgi:hypothetical protein
MHTGGRHARVHVRVAPIKGETVLEKRRFCDHYDHTAEAGGTRPCGYVWSDITPLDADFDVCTTKATARCAATRSLRSQSYLKPVSSKEGEIRGRLQRQTLRSTLGHDRKWPDSRISFKMSHRFFTCKTNKSTSEIGKCVSMWPAALLRVRRGRSTGPVSDRNAIQTDRLWTPD